MKIFNKENNREVVYVEKHEIDFLIKSNSIYSDQLKKYSNAFDFIRIDNSELVNYIKSLNWILDYKEYVNLSYDQIYNVREDVIPELSNVLYLLNSKSASGSIPSDKLKCEYHYLNNILKSLDELCKIKANFEHVKIPLIPDNYTKYEMGKYIVSNGFVPDTIFIRTVDGSKINEEIDNNIIKNILKNNKINIKDIKTKSYVINDGEYYVIKIIKQNYLNPIGKYISPLMDNTVKLK